MIIKNTTIQNKKKQKKLENEHIIPTHCITNINYVNNFLKSLDTYKVSKKHLIFSIGYEMVKGIDNPNLVKFLGEYNEKPIFIKDIPKDEFDLLGTVYQFLNSKKENLEKGSFYTGHKIALDMVSNLDLSGGKILLDPSCGSGSLLFRFNVSPNQIVGVDNDPIAVMIAKFNYFIKFPNADYPNIFCADFFEWCKNTDMKFDYIVGNPPYGATINSKYIESTHIKSGESFSYFIEYGYSLLNDDGLLIYLLPESILNVKKHTDIRNFILNYTNLKTIKKYKTKFFGVMSDICMLEIHKGQNEPNIDFIYDNTITIPKSIFKQLKNTIFTFFTKYDITIINKVTNLKSFDLTRSIFGLGIVTGNNTDKLFNSKVSNSEIIYTGKEVNKYTLSPPKKYIVFNRQELQQVAPDEIYRAQEKLIYKTINKKLIVALDTTGSLTTNSANIVIPKTNISIYTIMGLLNSQLYSYLNYKLFGGVNKVSKENLQSLPFPKLSKEQDENIKQMVISILDGGNDELLQTYINKTIFNLSKEEIAYINNFKFK